MSPLIIDFLQQLRDTTWLEWIGTATGLVCVYLAAKQHIWNWPISILSVTCYLVIFYQHRLYGDSMLQVYFLLTAIYGWYYWRKRDLSSDKPISSLSFNQCLITIAAIIILGASLGFALQRWTDTDVPYVDGMCTAMSFGAQLLMTRKILQSWMIWIAVNICYIPLYLHKDLAMTAVLYVIFAGIAWKGYRDWKNTYFTLENARTSTP
ncbi:nicotinamide riboside transporter PnuC [Sphingobacterium sp. lm-10]|uniref:nicotinamide riboside transporter PnuC n=1 Tax=Sphingobacterium sp. lm-10 TaxID=2944904 RepID=UPI0020215261|nr:nicotinamide riboside transporter PnuC [Sphingobacterium sp. lm-10]MCL7988951.1 nicotinamide riboside transporter PnuC [Sphingobacterium sp. lm-10]